MRAVNRAAAVVMAERLRAADAGRTGRQLHRHASGARGLLNGVAIDPKNCEVTKWAASKYSAVLVPAAQDLAPGACSETIGVTPCTL